ncbi:MAG: hypothetical protein J7521_20915 [Caulobacter sp.]|nr:hypothetical protein [Caulobacter sp.]
MSCDQYCWALWGTWWPWAEANQGFLSALAFGFSLSLAVGEWIGKRRAERRAREAEAEQRLAPARRFIGAVVSVVRPWVEFYENLWVLNGEDIALGIRPLAQWTREWREQNRRTADTLQGMLPLAPADPVITDAVQAIISAMNEFALGPYEIPPPALQEEMDKAQFVVQTKEYELVNHLPPVPPVL